MPTYNYECKACGDAFEEFLRMSEMDAPLALPCRKCGKEGEIIKVIGAPLLVRPEPFKGLSSDHKYAMKQLKKRHPRSNIPDY